MALMPFADFDAMLNPFEPLMPIDPFVFNRFNMNMPRSMRRSMHRLDREMGKLISSVKEDDKSFQVPRSASFLNSFRYYYYNTKTFFSQVTVDVSHFEPNEISVKTTDKNIIVHGMLVLLSNILDLIL